MHVPVTVFQCSCDLCHAEWTSRSDKLPAVCPKCKSKKWDSSLRDSGPLSEKPPLKRYKPKIVIPDIVYEPDHHGGA